MPIFSFGNVNANGVSEAESTSGDWESRKESTGVYYIDFTPGGGSRGRHSRTPVVIVGARGTSSEAGSDNVFSVYNVSVEGFYVSSLDVAPREGSAERGYYPQDADFSFIAISRGR